MIRDYFINFWVWWYFVKVPEWGEALLHRLMFVLQYTNTLVMAQNLTVPLFQDDSGVGKLLSFIIRGVWVWVGGMISAVMALPLILIWVAQAALPLVVIFIIIKGLLNIF
jgi:hypothetical protein